MVVRYRSRSLALHKGCNPSLALDEGGNDEVKRQANAVGLVVRAVQAVRDAMLVGNATFKLGGSCNSEV